MKVYRLTESDKSDIVTQLLDARALIVGSPTLNNGMFPSVGEFLCYLKGLKPKGRIGAVVGSYGWGGGATKAMRQEMEQTGLNMIEEDLAFKWVPEESELTQCTEFGRNIAGRMG